ncbi:MAG: SDR family NAD(P)-dependent oxidoreductase [Chlamydiae bacterium]|nr:SDR family NAD(P)-dependent oxidoreductase [Chlamydiota bacterium]
MIKDKTVLITGASSGFGKASAERFAELGSNLLLVARRYDRLHAIQEDLSLKYGVNVDIMELDVRNYKNIEEKLKDVEVDILINNAGLALTSDTMQQALVENWDTMIDTNIKGLLYMTKIVLPYMVKKNEGHIINVGSIAGRYCYKGGNVYCATKHAVKAISESLRHDLFGTKIRVSEVAPGAAETEFSEIRWNDQKRAKDFYQGFSPLVAEDIADAIIYIATRPKHVNISEMVIFPQSQSSAVDICRAGSNQKDPFAR